MLDSDMRHDISASRKPPLTIIYWARLRQILQIKCSVLGCDTYYTVIYFPDTSSQINFPNAPIPTSQSLQEPWSLILKLWRYPLSKVAKAEMSNIM